MASGFVLRQHHIWGCQELPLRPLNLDSVSQLRQAPDPSHMGWLCDFVAGRVNGQHQDGQVDYFHCDGHLILNNMARV